MKAASQQRRTLSFKEGLQEIKKTWGLTSGQAPDDKPQPADDRRARQPRADAKGERANDHRPKGQQRPRSAGAKPQGQQQQPQQQQAAHGKPGSKPAQQQRHGSQQKQARAHQQRARAAKPLPANLTDEERARIERNRQLNTIWNVLAKHYPTFRERLPLKIGVIDDLCARHPDIERTLLVAVLKRHVNHPRYHERVAAGGARYELDGTPSAGPGIEPSHIARANAALARQKAKAEARARDAAQQQGAAQPHADATQPQQPAVADAPAPADTAASQARDTGETADAPQAAETRETPQSPEPPVIAGAGGEAPASEA